MQTPAPSITVQPEQVRHEQRDRKEKERITEGHVEIKTEQDSSSPQADTVTDTTRQDPAFHTIGVTAIGMLDLLSSGACSDTSPNIWNKNILINLAKANSQKANCQSMHVNLLSLKTGICTYW